MEAEGRVKVKVEDTPIEEDVYEQLEKKGEPVEPSCFSKKKQTSEEEEVTKKKEEEVTKKKEEEVNKGREVDSSVEYKPFDRETGRVTERNKQYQEILEEEDEVF